MIYSRLLISYEATTKYDIVGMDCHSVGAVLCGVARSAISFLSESAL